MTRSSGELTAGGREAACGWLQDKYGLFWQVAPSAVPQMISEAKGEQLNRVMAAIMQSKKFDIATLQRAYAGQA